MVKTSGFEPEDTGSIPVMSSINIFIFKDINKKIR